MKTNPPSLKYMNNALYTFPNLPPLQNVLMIDKFTPNFVSSPLNETMTISFVNFSSYCQIVDKYTVTYEKEGSSDDLVTLLYLIKNKSKEFYEKKQLIMNSIYVPYLKQKFKISSFVKQENENRLKGGVYSIKKATISNKECYIVGGWVFAIYDQNDITYRNIISNTWDLCVTALGFLPPNSENEVMRLVTSYKNDVVSLWSINSFHIVKFIDNQHGGEFTGIQNIFNLENNNARVGIVDKTKVQIWSDWKKIDINYQITKENCEIVCSCYYFEPKKEENCVILADNQMNLIFITFKKESNAYEEKIHFTDEKNQILSLVYYLERNTLFAGNTKLVQLWDCYDKNKIELHSVHFLNDEIRHLEYYLFKRFLFLFCGGKKNLHLIHFER